MGRHADSTSMVVSTLLMIRVLVLFWMSQIVDALIKALLTEPRMNHHRRFSRQDHVTGDVTGSWKVRIHFRCT